MSIDSRELIFKILKEVNHEGAFSNIAISRNLNKNIDKLDESFVREIVYGVLENRMYIDWIIRKFSKTRFSRISPAIKEILRMGIYQIIFLDKIPDSAAVNEAVKLAKKHSHKGTHGYVNGVLRNVSRNKNTIKLPNKEKNLLEYLSIKYSHPQWMVEKWMKEFGEEFTEELCRANNEKPKLNIRVNSLKITREKLLELLKEKDFDVYKSELSEDGIIINNPVRITKTEEFIKGYFQIQDESSMLVTQVMNPQEGSFVIDIASAPGGKTTHIAEKMNNKGKIIARDVYDHKLKLIRENAERLGINIIETENYNAEEVDTKLIGKADYCLVDAPCSGLGLIRRKPDIKWNKEIDDIKEITTLQYNILNNASNYLKKGGILVYSTCTIEKEENINLIRKFLNNNKEFELNGFQDSIPTLKNTTSISEGYLELYPHIHNSDGFFIAKLLKKD